MSTMMTVPVDGDANDRPEDLAATQPGEVRLGPKGSPACIEDGGWQVGAIHAALKEAQAGDFASERDVVALRRKWNVKPR